MSSFGHTFIGIIVIIVIIAVIAFLSFIFDEIMCKDILDYLEQEPCEDAKKKLIKDCQPPANDWEHYADRLHDIAYKNGYEQAKKDMANVTTTDCISRQAVIDLCKNMVEKSDLVDVAYEVRRLPPISPERPKGNNCNTDYAECDQFVCSECGIELQDWHRVERDEDNGEVSYHEYTFRYCPNCGAELGTKDIRKESEQMSMITELVARLRSEAEDIRCNIDMDIPVTIANAELYERSAEVIEELSAKLQAANMDRSSQYYNGGWVSVEDRLPEPQEDGDADYSDWVLITLHIGKDNDVVGRAYYCFSRGKWYADSMGYCFSRGKWYADSMGIGEVTAWMPLLEPYKAESEDKECR